MDESDVNFDEEIEKWAPVVGRFMMNFVFIDSVIIHVTNKDAQKLTKKERENLDKFGTRVKAFQKIMTHYVSDPAKSSELCSVIANIKLLYEVRNLIAHNSLVFAFEIVDPDRLTALGFQINGQKKDFSLNFSDLEEKFLELERERKKFDDLTSIYYEVEFERLRGL